MLGVKMAKLTDQIIFNKSFNVEFKGYSTLEVDTFLDQVILDYQYFQFEIKKMQESLQSLQQQNAVLQARLIEAEGRLDLYQNNQESVPLSQSDLLKRLAKLEQEVYQLRMENDLLKKWQALMKQWEKEGRH